MAVFPSIIRNNFIFFLSLAGFFGGFLISRLNRPVLCVKNVDNDKFVPPAPPASASSCKPAVESDAAYCGLVGHVDNTNTFVHSNYFGNIKNSVLSTVFGMLHHPSCPVTAELVVTHSEEWSDDYSTCSSVYAVRSPVRDDHPNKCYAIMRALGHPNFNQTLVQPYVTNGICHRTGHIDWPQILTDQYQDDYIRHQSYYEEAVVTSLFLHDRDQIIAQFLATVGAPIDESTGRRRTLIVMIANEGVIDLLLNLLCSARAANVNLQNFIVFSGQEEYCRVLETMGVKAFFHASLGNMPKEAAGNYADRVFTKMMWLKVTSVYLALAAGFNVLFQDVDLVWVKDPVLFLEAQEKYDIIFMDDGARTPRFAPYFTNTGFYFVRHTPVTTQLFHRLVLAVGEIEYTASHQATLIRRITEAQGAFGLQILVLNDREFPSGRMYHEQHKYVEDVKAHKVVPYVWHMCWTANRSQKVTYYKDLGLWFLGHDAVCESAPMLLRWANRYRGRMTVFDMCCTNGGYWENYKPEQHP